MTKWNVSAFIVVVLGVIIVLGGAQLWLLNWANSGETFDIGKSTTLELERGDYVIAFESMDAPPPAEKARIRFKKRGEDQVQYLPLLDDDRSYKLWLSGWSGREVADFEIEESATYELMCFNNAGTETTPDGERVKVRRMEQSLEQTSSGRTLFQIVGLITTLVITIGLYVMHFRAVGQPKK